MILLFITVIVTPVICSLADRFRAHRTYFVVSLISTTIAVVFYSFLPLLLNSPNWNRRFQTTTIRPPPSAGSPLQAGPWIYFCVIALLCDLSMGVNTCLGDSFAVLQAEDNDTSFGRIIVWGTFGWAGSAIVLSFINQFTLLPRLVPGLIFGIILLSVDIICISFWPRSIDFKLDDIPTDAAQTLTASTYSVHRDPSDYLPSETIQVNLGQVVKDGHMKRRTLSPMDVLLAKSRLDLNDRSDVKQDFILAKTVKVGEANILRGADRGGSDNEQINSLSSVGTIRSDIERPTGDGQREMSVMMVSDGSKKAEKGCLQDSVSPLKEITAKATSARRSSDLQNATSFRLQLIMLGMILRRRKQLIRYLVLFVLAGFFMSMHWNYFFLYLEQTYLDKFEFISALSMVGQSILGELPFFILSRKVISALGRSHTLSLSVMSIGVRFLLYRYLLPHNNMYFVMLADCLQGPNYGLFYVAMTEISLEFSYCDDDTVSRLAALGEIDKNDRRQVDSVRLSLRSTVQSVAFACYEGIGVGLGSVAGGWIVGSAGFKSLWLYMAIGSIFVGCTNILIEIFCREHDPEEERSERRDFMDSRRKRILKKVTSPHPIPQAVQPHLQQSR